LFIKEIGEYKMVKKTEKYNAFVDDYCKQMERGCFPPTLGFRIDLDTFRKFVDLIIQLIPIHGWKNCQQYIAFWYLKVDKDWIERK